MSVCMYTCVYVNVQVCMSACKTQVHTLRRIYALYTYTMTNISPQPSQTERRQSRASCGPPRLALQEDAREERPVQAEEDNGYVCQGKGGHRKGGQRGQDWEDGDDWEDRRRGQVSAFARNVRVVIYK